MNTEQQSRNQKKSHHEDTKTRRNPFCKKTKHFRSFSWERTHLACSGNNRETVSTLEACAPRDDLCVPAVRFGVQALVSFWRETKDPEGVKQDSPGREPWVQGPDCRKP